MPQLVIAVLDLYVARPFLPCVTRALLWARVLGEGGAARGEKCPKTDTHRVLLLGDEERCGVRGNFRKPDPFYGSVAMSDHA